MQGYLTLNVKVGGTYTVLSNEVLNQAVLKLLHSLQKDIRLYVTELLVMCKYPALTAQFIPLRF
jgi:hypothetical protein